MQSNVYFLKLTKFFFIVALFLLTFALRKQPNGVAFVGNIALIMKYLKSIYSSLRWYEGVEYTLLVLMVMLLPVNYHLMYGVGGLLALMLLLKGLITRHWGNPALAPWVRISLAIPIVYVLLYAASLLWTSNAEAGRDELWELVPLLLFPAYFLLSDLSYLTTRRCRHLMWFFVVTLCVYFLVRLGIAVVTHLPKAVTATYLFSDKFELTHHAYLAMYLLLALGFLYTEALRLLTPRPPLPHYRWRVVGLILAAVLIGAFLVLRNSRAGTFILLLMGVGCTLHLLLSQRNRGEALRFFALFIVLATATYFVMPVEQHRLTNSLSKTVSGEEEDARIEIHKNSFEEALAHLPMGVGAGDRLDALAHYYQTEEKPDAHIFNPHNQYIDSTLTTGILGLLLLVAIFVLPFVAMVRRGLPSLACPYGQWRLLLIILIGIVSVSCMFESVLERQMGIQFWGLFSGLLLSMQYQESSYGRSVR